MGLRWEPCFNSNLAEPYPRTCKLKEMVPRFIAEQLAVPRRIRGRLVRRGMNRGNGGANAFAVDQLNLQRSDRLLDRRRSSGHLSWPRQPACLFHENAGRPQPYRSPDTEVTTGVKLKGSYQRRRICAPMDRFRRLASRSSGEIVTVSAGRWLRSSRNGTTLVRMIGWDEPNQRHRSWTLS